MNTRLLSPGRPRAHRWHPHLLFVGAALAFAGWFAPAHAAAQSADVVAGASAPVAVVGAETLQPVTSAPQDADVAAVRSLTGTTAGPADLVDLGVTALPEITGAQSDATAADDAAAQAVIVERAWVTDRYGAVRTQFSQGESVRLTLTAVNPSWNWRLGYLRLAVRMDIVCITAPCVGPEFVLLQGYKWFPPGRATYYLPVRIEATDAPGNWLFEARVDASAAQARFTIVEGAPAPSPTQNGVVVYDRPEYAGRAILVGAGNWQLPTGFRPQSLRLSGAYATGWRVDLYHTICPFVPPCTYQLHATYGADQPDLGDVGTGPYRLSVHR